MATESVTTEPDELAQLPPGDLRRLEVALELRKFHHTSIWEEQKHFTWLISLLLSALVIGATSDRVNSTARAVMLLVGSLVGFLLSMTAYRVQRREGVYYQNAYLAFAREWNLQFPHHLLGAFRDRPNKSLSRLVTAGLTGKAGVRDYFQILFLSFAAAFLCRHTTGSEFLGGLVAGGGRWRWRGDSNPGRTCALTRFRGVLLRPLGHTTAE